MTRTLTPSLFRRSSGHGGITGVGGVPAWLDEPLGREEPPNEVQQLEVISQTESGKFEGRSTDRHDVPLVLRRFAQAEFHTMRWAV
jgi:hypothetical protein